jgi:hypothetical protein
MTRRLLLLVAVLAFGTAPQAQAERPQRTSATVVRGGYVNDAGFVPAGLPSPGRVPGSYVVPFTGGSTWNGSFTGHTVISGTATLYETGAVEGTFTETFYGVYVPDQRYGSLTHTGRFSSDEHSLFWARSRIVGGTCGFASSSGTFAFDGASTNGGYVGRWRQPAGFAPPAGPCTG